jgi:hypothetical protein
MMRQALIVILAAMLLGAVTWGQTPQQICATIEGMAISEGLKETLCQDFQAGIARGHIIPERALQLLQAVGERITPQTQSAAEGMLTTIGWTINPAKGDLSAELLISRVFELFSKEQTEGESMGAAALEVTILSKALQSVAQVYRGLGITLKPDESKKVLSTEFGEIELTVSRVDTVITATAIALDRFERRLERRLDDFAGMKAEMMKELRNPRFFGAEPLPEQLIRYIDSEIDGSEWVPIVRQLASDRGRA